MDIQPKGRLLTQDEIGNLDNTKSISISFDFGESFDKNLKWTNSNFSAFLNEKSIEFKSTPLERILKELSLNYKMMEGEEQILTDVSSIKYSITCCGGCGCGMGPKAPPGYAYHSACWCCPKPPNLPPV